MDKLWLRTTAESRLEELKAEYRLYCNNESRTGTQLSYQSAAYYRTQCKKDIGLLEIVLGLINYAPKGELPFSDEAEEAWDRLLEPRRKS
jgi:hypothetical protein